MEFEDMQVIWDSQNNEKLFAINEATLFETITKKANKMTRTLTKVDIGLIGANLFVAVMLTAVYIWDGEPLYAMIIPVMYFSFFILAIYRRFARQKVYQQFEPTVLGELDKAIWQANYIIEQAKAMIWWYLVPLFAVISIVLLLDRLIWFVVFLNFVLFPVTYVASRWEIQKCYVPRKEELESLKALMLTTERGD